MLGNERGADPGRRERRRGGDLAGSHGDSRGETGRGTADVDDLREPCRPRVVHPSSICEEFQLHPLQVQERVAIGQYEDQFLPTELLHRPAPRLRHRADGDVASAFTGRLLQCASVRELEQTHLQ